MGRYVACLLDVYDTVLSVDMARHMAELAVRAGVEPATFAAAVRPWGSAVVDGRATIGGALEEVLWGWGRDRGQAAPLVAADRALLRKLAVVPVDTVPFLMRLRERAVPTAFVSNCADNTRPLLDALGLSNLVDELVLSCEVGAAKPEPRIYRIALERLGVGADETVFVDDQQAYCDAAAALGIQAVRIDRCGGSGAVSTLDDLAPYFD